MVGVAPRPGLSVAQAAAAVEAVRAVTGARRRFRQGRPRRLVVGCGVWRRGILRRRHDGGDGGVGVGSGGGVASSAAAKIAAAAASSVAAVEGSISQRLQQRAWRAR